MNCIPFLALLISTAAYAHGGGLDSQGGHNDRAAGSYHFHRGALAGETFASKDEATAALQVEVAPAPTVPLPAPQLPPVPPRQIRVASFNIRIFSTGSRDDTELALIADRLQQFDLVAIQELRDEEVVQVGFIASTNSKSAAIPVISNTRRKVCLGMHEGDRFLLEG
ncbi:MAG: YHYH domain-containing protein [bacterium]|nr:YHYH domain-containing protein [bacterium]